MSTSKKIVSILAAVVVLAVMHWYFISRPAAYFNAYGKNLVETASTTPDSSSTKKVSDAAQAPEVINKPTKNFMHTVTVQTSKGTIVFETYDIDAPKTVQNFVTLAGKGFYDNLIFHRVIPGFMIQGGDPTGTGSGGPGYQFADELDPATPSYKAGYVRGTVAMANSGPNTNGSQFFIMQADNPLPNSYSIFGKVISGMEVVDAIAKVPVDSSTHNMPLTPIKMTKVTVTAK